VTDEKSRSERQSCDLQHIPDLLGIIWIKPVASSGLCGALRQIDTSKYSRCLLQ